MLPCDIYPGFVQQVIQDISSALFTAVPLSGRLLVHSFQLLLLATFEIDILFPAGVVTYEPIILQVYHAMPCLRYCYSCFALVTILGNELVIFPGIVFYYGNNYMVSLKGQIMTFIAHLALL